MLENYETNWHNLLRHNSTRMPYDFIELFDEISKPYFNQKKLNPSDRQNIIMDLKESLVIECEITNECDSDNIRNFCHMIAFNILDKHKNSPQKIPHILSSLKSKN